MNREEGDIRLEDYPNIPCVIYRVHNGIMTAPVYNYSNQP